MLEKFLSDLRGLNSTGRRLSGTFDRHSQRPPAAVHGHALQLMTASGITLSNLEMPGGASRLGMTSLGIELEPRWLSQVQLRYVLKKNPDDSRARDLR